MGQQPDIQELEAHLMSGDLQFQVAALEQGKRIIDDLLKAALQGFKHTNNPLIYTDRLSALGQVIVPSVEELYRSYEEGEYKTALAILLLFLENRTGLEEVVGALSKDNPYHLLAAIKLANAGIHEAAEPITKLLRTYAFTEPMDYAFWPPVLSLVDSLRKLGGIIPPDITERLTGDKVPRHFADHVQKGEQK
jgi:hypothetical protein